MILLFCLLVVYTYTSSVVALALRLAACVSFLCKHLGFCFVALIAALYIPSICSALSTSSLVLRISRLFRCGQCCFALLCNILVGSTNIVAGSILVDTTYKYYSQKLKYRLQYSTEYLLDECRSGLNHCDDENVVMTTPIK